MAPTRRGPTCHAWIAALAVLIAGSLAGPARAGMVSFVPVLDNTLFADADGDTSNGAGPALFAGENSQGRIRRAVLAFDLSTAPPAEFSVDSVRLRLHVSNVSDASARVMSLHRLRASWGEGASTASGGSGAPATPGDATWIHRFFPGSPWSAPGGDFEPAPSATVVVDGVGDYEWTGKGLGSDVRFWREHPESNFGWILIGDESEPGTARRFDSREGPAEALRPILVIFTTEVPTLATSWGGIKTRYR
jgi:hypothetical protein